MKLIILALVIIAIVLIAGIITFAQIAYSIGGGGLATLVTLLPILALAFLDFMWIESS